jgi:cytochrome c biogenesis protein CcdA
MLAGSVGHKLRPVFIVLGASVTFTLMGGVFAALGLLASGLMDYIRLFSSLFIIAFGAIMADDDLGKVFSNLSSRYIARLAPNNPGAKDRSSLWGAFTLGLSLGIVWIPCVGPILGAVLAYSAVSANLVSGSLLLVSFSIGLGIPMLAIAYGGKYTSGKVDWAKDHSKGIKKVAGIIIVLWGIGMFLGFDKMIQTALVPYAPDLEEMLLLRGG